MNYIEKASTIALAGITSFAIGYVLYASKDIRRDNKRRKAWDAAKAAYEGLNLNSPDEDFAEYQNLINIALSV